MAEKEKGNEIAPNKYGKRLSNKLIKILLTFILKNMLIGKYLHYDGFNSLETDSIDLIIEY